MKRILFIIYLAVILTIPTLQGQSVVVNGYFNAADPRDEWIELVVVIDNTDMRSWTIRDNNSSQNSWQTAVAFNNISFWNNMRAGTVIIIWNRPVKSDGTTTQPLDVNKSDGYIELDATNTTYFNGGSFGSSPTWGGNSLNYASSGDIVELRNSGATHIHALGHATTAGSDWTAMPTPKLNHANNANSGDAIYVCPGAAITDYNGPATGNAFTSKNSGTITFGLPNTCGSSTTGNTTYWNALREPAFTTQAITPSSVTPGSPGVLSFSWAAATDPNASDNTTGYVILRSITNSFTAPTDGTTYTVGSALGGATVLAEINASGTVSYTDNTILIPNCYYYRIYAFRYGTDNLNGNNYDPSRGRAYNQTNFVTVNCPSILPVNLVNFTASVSNNNIVDLNWQTSTEANNDYFTIERSIDAVNFESVGLVKGNDYSYSLKNYSYSDSGPYPGTSYYQLKQTDFNGKNLYSEIATVFLEEKGDYFRIYPNPVSTELNISLSITEEKIVRVEIVNTIDQYTYITENLVEPFSINVSKLLAGSYLLKLYSRNKTYHKLFIKE